MQSALSFAWGLVVSGVLYVNTSVEEWDPYKDSQRNDPTKYTLYARHMEVRKMIESWGENRGPAAVADSAVTAVATAASAVSAATATKPV